MSLVLELRDLIPMAFVAAGLTNVPVRLAKATTSTERFRYEAEGALSTLDARRALVDPVTSAELSWSEPALRLILDAACGYPYFLQLFGSLAWDACIRASSTTIDATHAALALDEAQRQLDAGFYGARYDRLKELQRRYVDTLNDLLVREPTASGRIRTSQIASALGLTLQQCSPVRDSLIKSGMISAPSIGEVAFAIPGFSEFLVRRGDNN